MGAMERELQPDQCSLHSHSPAGNNPILSFSVAAVLLALLYLPRFFVHFILSPITISALALLSALLRHGANSPLPSSYTAQTSTQRASEEEAIDISFPETYISLDDEFPQNTNQLDHTEGGRKSEGFDFRFSHSAGESERDHDQCEVDDLPILPVILTKTDLIEAQSMQVEGLGRVQTNPFPQDLFERCRGDPLEVIYEEYGEGEDGTCEVEMEDFQMDLTDRSKQLTSQQTSADAGGRSEPEYSRGGFCFTDSDDSSSDSGGGSPPVAWWDFPHNQCFQWEVGDPDEEGMIEIPLEDDNLIELDLSVFR